MRRWRCALLVMVLYGYGAGGGGIGHRGAGKCNLFVNVITVKKPKTTFTVIYYPYHILREGTCRSPLRFAFAIPGSSIVRMGPRMSRLTWILIGSALLSGRRLTKPVVGLVSIPLTCVIRSPTWIVPSIAASPPAVTAVTTLPLTSSPRGPPKWRCSVQTSVEVVP